MKSKTIISMLVLTVFFAGIFVLPAFAKSEAVIHGPNRWAAKTEAEPSSAQDVAEGTENFVDGTLNAAGEIINGSLRATEDLASGTLTFSGDVVNGTMDAAGRLMDEAFNTSEGAMEGDLDASQGLIDEALNTSGDIIQGTLDASGALIDGTGNFVDESVTGTREAVFGPEEEVEIEFEVEDTESYEDIDVIEDY